MCHILVHLLSLKEKAMGIESTAYEHFKRLTEKSDMETYQRLVSDGLFKGTYAEFKEVSKIGAIGPSWRCGH